MRIFSSLSSLWIWAWGFLRDHPQKKHRPKEDRPDQHHPDPVVHIAVEPSQGLSAEVHRPRWLDIAERELAVSEIPGEDHNPRILEYHATTTLAAAQDEVPWCSSFVNWVLQKAGIPGTRSAAARSWLAWGRTIDEARSGCVTVLSRGDNPKAGHVGFYVGDQGPHVLILGGNQQNAVSVASFPEKRVLGYRWPEGPVA